MNTLIDNVRQWFHEKGIIEKSNPLKQLGKTQEELTETRDAAVKLDWLTQYDSIDARFSKVALQEELTHELKDGIGDTLVTLIGVCEMLKYDITKLVKDQKEHGYADDIIGSPLQILEVMQTSLLELHLLVGIHSPASAVVIRKMFCQLVAIADSYEFLLEECLQQAYDVISKRTGRMENGIFVKDKEVRSE